MSLASSSVSEILSDNSGDVVSLFLGEDLLPLLTLAIGGAMVVGTVTALFRPRPGNVPEGELARPPIVRSVIQILIGTVASIWAVATLLG